MFFAIVQLILFIVLFEEVIRNDLSIKPSSMHDTLMTGRSVAYIAFILICEMINGTEFSHAMMSGEHWDVSRLREILLIGLVSNWILKFLTFHAIDEDNNWFAWLCFRVTSWGLIICFTMLATITPLVILFN